MAWGRKTVQIADLQQRCIRLDKELRDTNSTEARRADRAARENDELKREKDDLKREKDTANAKVGYLEATRESLRAELSAAQARERELEWAVHLLNASLSRKLGADIGDPFDEVLPSTLEAARGAVRERDIVVKWDELDGAATVHFPKKDQRRAPWAQGAMHIGFSAADLIYDPSRSSVGPFSPIENPA